MDSWPSGASGALKCLSLTASAIKIYRFSVSDEPKPSLPPPPPRPEGRCSFGDSKVSLKGFFYPINLLTAGCQVTVSLHLEWERRRSRCLISYLLKQVESEQADRAPQPPVWSVVAPFHTAGFRPRSTPSFGPLKKIVPDVKTPASEEKKRLEPTTSLLPARGDEDARHRYPSLLFSSLLCWFSCSTHHLHKTMTAAC